MITTLSHEAGASVRAYERSQIIKFQRHRSARAIPINGSLEPLKNHLNINKLGNDLILQNSPCDLGNHSDVIYISHHELSSFDCGVLLNLF